MRQSLLVAILLAPLKLVLRPALLLALLIHVAALAIPLAAGSGTEDETTGVTVDLEATADRDTAEFAEDFDFDAREGLAYDSDAALGADGFDTSGGGSSSPAAKSAKGSTNPKGDADTEISSSTMRKLERARQRMAELRGERAATNPEPSPSPSSRTGPVGARTTPPPRPANRPTAAAAPARAAAPASSPPPRSLSDLPAVTPASAPSPSPAPAPAASAPAPSPAPAASAPAPSPAPAPAASAPPPSPAPVASPPPTPASSPELARRLPPNAENRVPIYRSPGTGRALVGSVGLLPPSLDRVAFNTPDRIQRVSEAYPELLERAGVKIADSPQTDERGFRVYRLEPQADEAEPRFLHLVRYRQKTVIFIAPEVWERDRLFSQDRPRP